MRERRFWILDFGFWIAQTIDSSVSSSIQNPKSKIQNYTALDRLLARLSSQPRLAAAIVRLLRAYIRFAPFSVGKRWLWSRVIDPHFAWNKHCFDCQTRFAGRITGDTRDILQQYLFYFGVWEPNLTHWLVRRLQQGDTFIDVGANIGYYSLLASRIVGPKGSVVAIEPSPAIFHQLQENLRNNKATNVRAINRAASDSEGTARLFRGPVTNGGLSTIVVGEADLNDCQLECDVATAPLGKLLTTDEIKNARIIKIDVEGTEWQVALGMQPLLSALRADLEIMVEVCPQRLARQGHSAPDLLALFQDAGFHPYLIENDYSAAAYLTQQAPRPPVRLRRPIEHEVDLIFSRTDAEAL